MTRSCPSCGADDPIRTKYGRGEWWVARCGGCGFAYLADAPSYEAVQNQFEWTQSYARERKRRRSRPLLSLFNRLVKLRKRLLPSRRPMDIVARHASGGSVLDIGCGDGGMLAPFRSRYRLFG